MLVVCGERGMGWILTFAEGSEERFHVAINGGGDWRRLLCMIEVIVC